MRLPPPPYFSFCTYKVIETVMITLYYEFKHYRFDGTRLAM